MPSVSDARLRAFVGYTMKRATNAVQADLAAALAPFDLRIATFSALVLIVENPGLSQSQLAEALAVERSNLVVIVDDLERRALILRNPVPGDRRTYALTATLAGRRLCDKALVAAEAHEERLMAGLSGKDRAAIISAMELIRRAGRGEGT